MKAGWDGTRKLLVTIAENPIGSLPYWNNTAIGPNPIFNVGSYQDIAIVQRAAG